MLFRSFYRLAYGSLIGKLVFLAFSWLVVLLLAVAHICLRYRLGSTDDCIGYTATARRPGANVATADRQNAKAGETHATHG